jgi:hypothetical protein
MLQRARIILTHPPRSRRDATFTQASIALSFKYDQSCVPRSAGTGAPTHISSFPLIFSFSRYSTGGDERVPSRAQRKGPAGGWVK